VTLLGFELVIPGRVPEDLVASAMGYYARAKEIDSRARLLSAKLRRKIEWLTRAVDAGTTWLIRPFDLHEVEDGLQMMETLVKKAEKLNEELKTQQKEWRQWKVQLNFNSPAPARVYYAREGS